MKSCLEKARQDLFATLDALRAGKLSDKEADAVAAAIEDELITLRVSLLRRPAASAIPPTPFSILYSGYRGLICSA